MWGERPSRVAENICVAPKSVTNSFDSAFARGESFASSVPFWYSMKPDATSISVLHVTVIVVAGSPVQVSAIWSGNAVAPLASVSLAGEAMTENVNNKPDISRTIFRIMANSFLNLRPYRE